MQNAILVKQVCGVWMGRSTRNILPCRPCQLQGVTILPVEQNAKLALEAAQRGYVLESGAITLSGAASELLGSDAVQRAYLGA